MLPSSSALFLAVTLCFVGGCGNDGPRTATVKGTVIYKGKAVPRGTVMFMPAAGAAATAELGADGTYTLSAVLGKHKVVIVAIADRSGALPEDRNPLAPALIPDKYTAAATTPLEAEVKDEVNTIDFHLDGERK